MARPKMHPKETRSVRFNLRFTAAERVHVDDQARIAGLAVHEFCRRRVLGYKVPPAPAQRRTDPGVLTELNNLWRQLKAIGNNANQIALNANTGRRERQSWEGVVGRVHELADAVEARLEQLVDEHD